ncbi:cadherin-23, partial [Nilaparvata lugens]|uniref:cadherin-23 n=1 Tax=Nilaparvata lugens TaxID=108931 RepID=UPI00193CDFB4
FQGNNGTFEMYIDDDRGIFDVTQRHGINEATFLIRVKDPTKLDYETTKVMNFTLVAKKSVPTDPKFSFASVTVYIRDVNDNFPEFAKPVYEVSIPENSGPGTTVVWVQATDDDSGNFGSQGIRYTNLRGSVAEMLSLDSRTGIITIKNDGAHFDREQMSRHYLTVEARDDMGLGNRNTAQLVLNIEDVNDNAPIFLQSRYEGRLHENQMDFDTPLVIEARDMDLNGTKNSRITYSISEWDRSKANFTIDPATGTLKLMGRIDFERLPRGGGQKALNPFPVHLKVRATDMGSPPLHSEVPVTIYIHDVNDFAPQFEVDSYEKTIPEDLSEGSSVLQVNAWDGDGSPPNNVVVYRIQSGAGDKFTMDVATGVIRVARGASLDPDGTQPRTLRYALVIVALDGGIGAHQLSATVPVQITIDDVNNKPPVLAEPGTVRIKENTRVGQVVHRVVAQDPDESPVLRYTLDADSCEARSEEGTLVKAAEFDFVAAFELNPLDGRLKVVRLLDRERVETIRLAIRVEDLGSTTGVQTDTVSEVNAWDGDGSPPNNVVVYRIQSGAGDKSQTWRPVVKWCTEWLPRTRTRARCCDTTGRGQLWARSEEGTLVKAAEFDYVAAFELNPSTDDLSEIVKRLHGSQGKFQINPETGVLNISDRLNREEQSAYMLVIEAWDNYQFGYASGESRNAFKQIVVNVLDVNDEAPVLDRLPEQCVTVTEFHDPSDVITQLKATDADDPNTPNSWVQFSFIAGNDDGLFQIKPVDNWSAHVLSTGPLKKRYGNYSLVVRAQDLGMPPNSVVANLHICVTDFNDNAPRFLSPPHNITIRVAENETIGTPVITVEAVDDDIGPNGAVRYRLRQDNTGDWRTFNIDQDSGLITLKQPLDRERQKIYQIRVEAYDHGVPTPLSSDLDLTIYVKNINDYQPQFVIEEYTVNFTEHVLPGTERRQLAETIDRDEVDDLDDPPTPVCYFIVAGNEDGFFGIEPLIHQITAVKELDREVQERHELIVKASEDCATTPPTNNSWFELRDETLLKLIVNVNDINDNPPLFVKNVFTGGVTTEADFGTEFMHVKAVDADTGENAVINYYMLGETQMTLSEGMDGIQQPPFLVDQGTGAIHLNFDPQKGMKGYFDFMVMANDSGGLYDMARVFIYLLREDQRVRFVLRQHPTEIREKIDHFREILGNVTGAIVNIDEMKVHETRDGRVDKTRSDLYMHFVNQTDHSIMEVNSVLRLIDQSIERLDTLFKEFNVLDTQGAERVEALRIAGPDSVVWMWLVGCTLFLTLLLVVVIALCLSQRARYQRQLKAATITAFGTTESDLTGRVAGRVPNTNMHSVEGSNPIWMQAYENEWYKEDDSMSQASERDSLDENAVVAPTTPNDGGGNSSCNSRSNMINVSAVDVPAMVKEQNDLNKNGGGYHQNLYHHLDKLSNPLIAKKLETTEL